MWRYVPVTHNHAERYEIMLLNLFGKMKKSKAAKKGVSRGKKKYILSLVERMSCDEKPCNSDNSIRWYAYREAERKADREWLPYLQEIIDENKAPKQKNIRRAVYFNARAILKKKYDADVCAFLMSALIFEQDKYILSAILDGLAWMKSSSDMDPGIITELSKHEKWLIRHSAIRALGSFPKEESKKALYFYLMQDDEKKYRNEIIYANASLGKIGCEEDIPVLERHIRSRSRDIKESAKFAIGSIQERRGASAAEPFSGDSEDVFYTPYGVVSKSKLIPVEDSD